MKEPKPAWEDAKPASKEDLPDTNVDAPMPSLKPPVRVDAEGTPPAPSFLGRFLGWLKSVWGAISPQTVTHKKGVWAIIGLGLYTTQSPLLMLFAFVALLFFGPSEFQILDFAAQPPRLGKGIIGTRQLEDAVEAPEPPPNAIVPTSKIPGPPNPPRPAKPREVG